MKAGVERMIRVGWDEMVKVMSWQERMSEAVKEKPAFRGWSELDG